jgi:hypothetical protein
MPKSRRGSDVALDELTLSSATTTRPLLDGDRVVSFSLSPPEGCGPAFRAAACRPRRQLRSVACSDSASVVAAQLPRSFSASSEREPGSAV